MDEQQIRCLEAYAQLSGKVFELNDTVLALNKSITNLSDRVRGLERKLPKLDTTFRSSVYQHNNLKANGPEATAPAAAVAMDTENMSMPEFTAACPQFL